MKDIVNVSDFKEYGSGAVQAAVYVCAANGGGTVVVPAGEWKTAAIHLKSNIRLHLADGAVLSFSTKFSDYLPVVFTRWEGTECYNYSPLIYAKDCENIAVTGKGTLNGNGEAWWHWKKLQQKAANELAYAEGHGIPPENRVYGTEEAALRPSFIQFINCKNVTMEDFTIKNGPQWTIHPVYCEDVVIRGVNVDTAGPNTDGLNPDSCKNVLIENCTFCTGDDCVAINSGLNADGRRVALPCENVEVKKCVMNGGHGAVVIGSAISGGVNNINIHDCRINGTMQGVRIKSMRGRGGYVHNVRFSDLEINDVTDQAVQINMFYEFSTVKPESDEPTDCDNIVIENVKGSSKKTGIQIKGLPELKLKNIKLNNIQLTAADAMTCTDAQSVEFNNVKVEETK